MKSISSLKALLLLICFSSNSVWAQTINQSIRTPDGTLSLTYNTVWIEPSEEKKQEILDSIPSSRQDLIDESIIANSQFYVQGYWRMKQP